MSGKVGDNLFRASGVIAAAAAGGGVSWQSVETAATFTAVAGNGYPVNTTSNACTVTLPASTSVGDEIIFTDYARNFETNALTIDQNSLKYQGNATPNPIYDTDGESVHIVYMDVTNGWIPINDGAVAMETPQSYSADFLVVAGGASGGSKYNGGGGGAGGYRTSTQNVLEGQTVTVTVGDGGTAVSDSIGNAGSASSFSGAGTTTITSAGGGAGGGDDAGGDGGSGGGGGTQTTGAGGSGNTPSTSPSQGSDGGTAFSNSGGGGGGASAVGQDGQSSVGGVGGAGSASSITSASVTYAGGGGGCNQPGAGPAAGGAGGGGAANAEGGTATSGTANTGGAGGAARLNGTSGAGGKGVVILSVPDANYTGTTTGSPTVVTDAGGTGKTVMTFTGTGSYTA